MKHATVTAPVIIAAAVNIVYDVRNQNSQNVPRIIFGNVALFAGLMAVSEYIDESIAAMLAVLYLLHTMLTDGVKVIEWTTALTDSI